MPILNLDAFRATPLAREPYEHLIVPGFVDTHIHYPQIDILAAYGSDLLGWLERNDVNLVLRILAGGAVYAGGLLLTGTLSRADLASLMGRTPAG